MELAGVSTGRARAGVSTGGCPLMELEQGCPLVELEQGCPLVELEQGCPLVELYLYSLLRTSCTNSTSVRSSASAFGKKQCIDIAMDGASFKSSIFIF